MRTFSFLPLSMNYQYQEICMMALVKSSNIASKRLRSISRTSTIMFYVYLPTNCTVACLQFWHCRILHQNQEPFHQTLRLLDTMRTIKHEQCRFWISTIQTKDDNPMNDEDKKCTNKKITYKENEGCPVMDMVVPG